MPGDGKSTSVSNLAIAFAQAGDRTLVLDCDLRKPVQHLIFGVNSTVGLTDVINDDVKLKDAVQSTNIDNLYVLSCGTQYAHPSEMLGGKRFAMVLAMLAKSFDRIIIDSPPVLRFTDGRILASMADITVMCLRMNQSMRTLGIVALNGLDKVGANVVGAIANDVPASKANVYYGGSSHYFSRARNHGQHRMLPSSANRSVVVADATQQSDESVTDVSGTPDKDGKSVAAASYSNGKMSDQYVNGSTTVATTEQSSGNALKIGDLDWNEKK